MSTRVRLSSPKFHTDIEPVFVPDNAPTQPIQPQRHPEEKRRVTFSLFRDNATFFQRLERLAAAKTPITDPMDAALVAGIWKMSSFPEVPPQWASVISNIRAKGPRFANHLVTLGVAAGVIQSESEFILISVHRGLESKDNYQLRVSFAQEVKELEETHGLATDYLLLRRVSAAGYELASFVGEASTEMAGAWREGGGGVEFEHAPTMPFRVTGVDLPLGDKAQFAPLSPLLSLFSDTDQRTALLTFLWHRDRAPKAALIIPQNLTLVMSLDPTQSEFQNLTVYTTPVWNKSVAKWNPDGTITVIRCVGDPKTEEYKVIGGSGPGATRIVSNALYGQDLVAIHPFEQNFLATLLATVSNMVMPMPNLDMDVMASYLSEEGSAAIEWMIAQQKVVQSAFEAGNRVVVTYGQNGANVRNIRLRSPNKKGSLSNNGIQLEFERDGDGWKRVEIRGEVDDRIVAATENLSGGRVLSPDASANEQVAEEVRRLAQAPKGFASLDGEMCKSEPLSTPADLKKVEPLINVPVELKDTSPGFAPTPLTPQDLATPPSLLIPSLSGEGHGEGDCTAVDLPEFIGADTFLPEPSTRMLVAGYGILAGGVLLGVAASTVEVPSGIAAGVVRGAQVIISAGRPILAY